MYVYSIHVLALAHKHVTVHGIESILRRTNIQVDRRVRQYCAERHICYDATPPPCDRKAALLNDVT